MQIIFDRIRLWRADAEVLRRRGAVARAAMLERLAAELEEDLARDAPPLVDLGRAADLSGYTRGHLRRMLMEGGLVNHGSEARPLVLAADLPRKPGGRAPSQ